MAERDLQKIARRTRSALFGVRGVGDELKAQWDQAIADFQAARNQLSVAEQALYDHYAIAAQDEDDLDEWQSLFNKVNAQMSTMDALAGAVTTAANWWNDAKNWIGLSGSLAGNLSGALGIALPALPVSLVVLTGAVAAAAAIYGSVVAFTDYLTRKENYRHDESVLSAANDARETTLNAGGSVEQADAAANNIIRQAEETATRRAQQESGYSFGARIENVLLWAVGGAVVVALAPIVLKQLTARR